MLTFPLEAEVGVSGLVHVHMMICAAQICGAAEGAILEEGAALPLEGFHLEFLLAEVTVHVPAVPDEPALTLAVERDPEGEDAREGRAVASDHDAGGHAGGDGVGNESRLRVRGRMVAEERGRRGAELRVPLEPITRI